MEPRAPALASEWRTIVSILEAADELAACREMDSMMRRATELARERIGLERVGFYVRDPSAARIILRGTWGTGIHGETTDERALFHEISSTDYQALRELQIRGSLWMYEDHAPHYAQERGRTIVIGHGWKAVTPLVSARDVVGVMYNDAALSHSPVDENRQARAAVFCSLLAGLILSRRGAVSLRPRAQETGRSPIVQRVLRALQYDPVVTGQHLAREMGISPGHLARSFKLEMGVSLVEYRNRLRIERFLSSVDRGGSNLVQAALEAGFGSYAQFHRVYRKLLGTTPREHLTGRRSLTSSDQSG